MQAFFVRLSQSYYTFFSQRYLPHLKRNVLAVCRCRSWPVITNTNVSKCINIKCCYSVTKDCKGCRGQAADYKSSQHAAEKQAQLENQANILVKKVHLLQNPLLIIIKQNINKLQHNTTRQHDAMGLTASIGFIPLKAQHQCTTDLTTTNTCYS